jgi:transposase
MRTGRPIAELVVTGEEEAALERCARRPNTAQALAMRSKIVLSCAKGKSNTVVADELGITKQTVGKWRARFWERRLDGLLDEPRPGTPRKVGDEEVERVLALTLESTPRDATHWSTRSLAAEAGLRRSTVSRSGVLSLYSPTAARPSNCRRIRCLSRRSVTSPDST